MLAKLLTTAGLAAGLVLTSAPAAHADDGCVTDLVNHAYGYGYSYRTPEGWVTVDGIDISVNGSQAVGDTKWNVFVTQDYAGYWAGGAGTFVSCVV